MILVDSSVPICLGGARHVLEIEAEQIIAAPVTGQEKPIARAEVPCAPFH